MKRNRRAVTRTPLADKYFTPRVVISTVHNPLPAASLASWLFGLKREATTVEHEVKGDRLKLRTRNRVTLPNRSVPRAGDRTPGNNYRVDTRRELRGVVDARRLPIAGTFIEAPTSERLCEPRKPVKRVKLATESERKRAAKREAKRLRVKAHEARERKRLLDIRQSERGIEARLTWYQFTFHAAIVAARVVD